MEKEIIGIAGFGNMGSAIWKALHKEKDILIYDPYITQFPAGSHHTENINDFIMKSDIIILCVKPDKVKEFLSEVKSPKKIISIAAGITLSSIRENLPEGSSAARLMPNLPLTVGQGAIGYISDNALREKTAELFSKLGLLVEVSKEELMNSVTGLSGSGPAFVFSFIQAMAEGGVKCGLSYDQALRLAVQTVKGSAEYLEEELSKDKSIHPSLLRNRVTSPGGTTIYGLEKLEENSFHFAVMNAVFTAFKRSEELGK